MLAFWNGMQFNHYYAKILVNIGIVGKNHCYLHPIVLIAFKSFFIALWYTLDSSFVDKNACISLY